LDTYLKNTFPFLTRIASPRIHELPRGLRTEAVNIAGGNADAAVYKKLMEVFAEASRNVLVSRNSSMAAHLEARRQVIIFCNRASRANMLGTYLNERGLPNLVLTGASGFRNRGSNAHLSSFLNRSEGDDSSVPRILITTSLLARGLDFSPKVTHVFIVDEPRNEIDFLHRAGRTARAGQQGTVVVFGKRLVERKKGFS
jgi:ATP-dependent RNA helicase MRH4, mitochondrial